MVRNESIDSLKGILIIFVIIGHALHGTLDENILRYVIYSFHMPVFLFISGYLINLQRIQSLSAKDLLAKYWKRMLFPWGVALFFYSFVLSISHFTLLEFVEKLSHPYYHLWYVPTLFVFICIVWMITHVKERTVALIFLVALGLIFSNMHIKVGCLRMCYFIFFMFGVISKNSDVKVENLLVSGGVFSVFIVVQFILFVYGISFEYYNNNLMLPFMLVVCLLSVLPIFLNNKLKSSLMCNIGVHSLEIYLWHVFPIMVLKLIFKEGEAPYLYYLFIVCLMALMLAVVQLKSKYFVVNKNEDNSICSR